MSSSFNMEDELPLLRSAFLIEQMSVDRPGFVVKCGSYTWKIHRRLLFHQSREKDLFRTSSGRAATSADLDQDHPWMVARLLQFLYTQTYDAHYFESYGGRSTIGCTLETILSGKNRTDEATFAKDKERDYNRSELEVHLMMCNMAVKHEMSVLIDHALHRACQCQQGDTAASEVLKKALLVIGMQKITNDDGLRKLFAGYIADNREKIDEATLRQRLKDGTFAIEVVDYLKQKNRDLERRASLTEIPPNLKKRRPSFAESSGWTPPKSTDCETVTTPILANRTIIEERRSATHG